MYSRVPGLFPALLFVAAIVLLTPRADANSTPPSTRCAPQPMAAGSAGTALQPTDDDTLTVGSLNLHADVRTLEVLESWTHQRSIDVLLLQEVGDDDLDGKDLSATLGSRLGFGFAYAPANLREDGTTEGLAIVSRYPLEDVSVQPLPYHRLPFRSRCRIALAATIAAPTGPVRFVNVHLDTRINSGSRIAQLTPAVELLGVFDGPRIVGGDFNTMTARWVLSMLPLFYLQRQADDVREWLASQGFDTPFTDTPATLSFPVIPMRVDWIYLKEFESLARGVDRIQYSDHRGIWASVNPMRRVAEP